MAGCQKLCACILRLSFQACCSQRASLPSCRPPGGRPALPPAAAPHLPAPALTRPSMRHGCCLLHRTRSTPFFSPCRPARLCGGEPGPAGRQVCRWRGGQPGDAGEQGRAQPQRPRGAPAPQGAQGSWCACVCCPAAASVRLHSTAAEQRRQCLLGGAMRSAASCKEGLACPAQPARDPSNMPANARLPFWL